MTGIISGSTTQSEVEPDKQSPPKKLRKLMSNLKRTGKVQQPDRHHTTGILAVVCQVIQQGKQIRQIGICCEGVSHYATDWADLTWGCGYRNTQQVLSSLRAMDPEYYEACTGQSYEPSIKQIQLGIQRAWENGIDVEGAKQLNWRLVESRKWIGTTEVYAYLTDLGYDATIIQFSGINVATKLMDFCRFYFEMDVLPSSVSQIRRTNKYPLYFQHQGHSRTIVGYEHGPDGPHLLVFDPAKRVSGELREMCKKTDHTCATQTCSKGLSNLTQWVVGEKSLKKKAYQLLQINGKLEKTATEEKKIIRPRVM